MKRIRIMGLCLVAAFAMTAMAASSASAGLTYGKCLKKGVAGGAGFSDAGCTKAVGTAAKYEWVKGGATGVLYTTEMKAGTLATLETVKKEKVVCKGETSTGKILSETNTETTPTFTGCEALENKCSTPLAAEGEIRVGALEGELGVITKGSEPKLDKVGSNLFKQGNRGGQITEFKCGGFTVKVNGNVIFPLTSNKMLTTATIKFTASKGKQKPEKFATGPKETLESSFAGGPFFQSGQTITTIEKNASAIETNTVA